MRRLDSARLVPCGAQQSSGSQSREPASCRDASTKQRMAKDQGINCGTGAAIITGALPRLSEAGSLVEPSRRQVVGRRLEPDAVRPGQPGAAEQVVEQHPGDALPPRRRCPAEGEDFRMPAHDEVEDEAKRLALADPLEG